MSDDEPDYMSDDFLKSCVGGDASLKSAVNVRPGLLFSHQQRRAVALERGKSLAHAQQRQLNPSRVQLEQEHRDRGLSQPIDASNKGFAMLKMMGYKPGTAIGKQGEGRLEPVQVALKSDRGGLGRQAALEELCARKHAIRAERRRKCAANAAEDFRRRMRDKMADRYLHSDLMKSQRVCQQLDEKICVKTPAEIWFWPEEKLTTNNVDDDDDGQTNDDGEKEASVSKEEDENGVDDAAHDLEDVEDEIVEFSSAEKLEMLTAYLRASHLYCIWCGCSFQDGDDMRDNCPGCRRDDHS